MEVGRVGVRVRGREGGREREREGERMGIVGLVTCVIETKARPRILGYKNALTYLSLPPPHAPPASPSPAPPDSLFIAVKHSSRTQ